MVCLELRLRSVAVRARMSAGHLFTNPWKDATLTGRRIIGAPLQDEEKFRQAHLLWESFDNSSCAFDEPPLWQNEGSSFEQPRPWGREANIRHDINLAPRASDEPPVWQNESSPFEQPRSWWREANIRHDINLAPRASDEPPVWQSEGSFFEQNIRHDRNLALRASDEPPLWQNEESSFEQPRPWWREKYNIRHDINLAPRAFDEPPLWQNEGSFSDQPHPGWREEANIRYDINLGPKQFTTQGNVARDSNGRGSQEHPWHQGQANPQEDVPLAQQPLCARAADVWSTGAGPIHAPPVTCPPMMWQYPTRVATPPVQPPILNDWAPPPPDAGGILGRIMKDVRFKRTFRAHQQDDFSVDQQPLTPWEQPNKRHRREWGVGASSFPAHPRDFPPNPVHPSPIPQVPLSRRFKKAKRRLQQQNQQQVVSVVPKGGYPFKPSTGPPKVNFSKKKSAAPSSNTATPVTFTAKANPGDSKKGQKRPAEDDKQQPEAKRALPDKENRPDDNNNAAVRVEVIVPWRKPTKEPKRGDVIDVPLKEAVALLKGSGAWEVTVEKLPFGAVSGWRALAPREKTSLVDDVLKSARLWSPQSKEEIVKMVDLDPRSAEYLDLEQRFLATSVNKNFVVTRIERVQNPYLRGMFLLKKEEIEQRCGEVAVVRLYHGTPRENIESICKGNLDWRMHGLGTGHRWWGHGVSLSPISYYSSHYGDKGRERSMIVCDVIIGSVSSGRGIVIPPLVPGGKPNQRYDTNMKLIPSPQTVVKFDDHEFYPAYVISYNAPEDDSDWLTTYSPYDYYDYGYGYDRNPFDYNYQVQNSIENYMADNHYKYYWNR